MGRRIGCALGIGGLLALSLGANTLHGHAAPLPTTTTSLTSAPNPSTSGEFVTLTATVAPAGTTTPTGTVQFKDGVADLSGAIAVSPAAGNDASATFATSTLPVGTHSLTAVYSGDAANAGSPSTAVAQVVTRASSTTAASSSNNPSTLGDSVTFTATVTGAGGTPTGTFVFSDGTTPVSAGQLDAAGTATYTTSSLTLGSHSINTAYLGDTNHTASNGSVVQVVRTASTTALVSTTNPSNFGNSVILNATVTGTAAGGNPTGTVAFLDGTTALSGSPVTVSPSGSDAATASLTVSSLATSATGHSLTAVYSGDSAIYSGSSSAPPTIQVVNPANSAVTVVATPNSSPQFGDAETLTATVSPSAATGTITFKDGATVIGTGTIAGGVAITTTSALAVGPHSITAAYGGDTNDTAATSPAITVTVAKATDTVVLTANPNPVTFGQVLTLSADVPGATGTVTFMDGSTTLGAGTLAAGTASMTTSTLAVGTYPITAVYGGDSSHTTSTSGIVSVQVSDLTNTVLTSNSNPSTYGGPVTFTATVSGATILLPRPNGTVIFMDGATTLGSGPVGVSGTATFSTSSLTAGSHSVTAVYSGGAQTIGNSTFSFAPSTSPMLVQVVNQATTTTTVGAVPTTAVYGTPVALTATVTPSNATGTVTFSDGGTAIGSPVTLIGGTATLTTSALSVGVHSITATYSGDGNFVTSSSSLATIVTVSTDPTTTTLAAAPSPSTYGQTVSLTATVNDGATGTVSFLDGATVLGSGTLNGSSPNEAVFTTSSLAAGGHSLSAAYAGDTNDSSSTSGTTNLTVAQSSSTTSLSSDVNPSTPGQTVTLTATVGSGATGTVTFNDGGSAIGSPVAVGTNGSATLGTNSLTTPGTHSITAVYSGDSNFLTSTSPALAQVVANATTTALASSLNPSNAGQSVVLTATVTPSSATGSVTFMDGATALGSGPSSLSSGVGTLTTSSLAVGTHSITAVYSGDTLDLTSTSNAVSQVVNPVVTTVVVTPHSHTLAANGTAHTTVTAVLTDSGAAVSGDTVTFTSNPAGAVTFGAVTYVSGASTGTDGTATATMTAGKNAGTVTVTATENLGGTTGTATEKLKSSHFRSAALAPSSIAANGTSTTTATVFAVDDNNNPVAGETVTFADGTANGATVTPSFVTGADGKATATVTSSRNAGTDTITATDTNGDPNADASAAGTYASPMSLTQTAVDATSFVNAAYNTMLGAGAANNDQAGVNYWIDQITNHGVSRASFASALASSPAYRNGVIAGKSLSDVNDFYMLYLDRVGETAGINYWVGQMAAPVNMTFEQVRLRFAGSSEYFSSSAVGNNDKLTAIRALYTDLLGRTDGGNSDTAGQAYWMSHYNASVIAAQFLFSSEGRSYLVNTLYQQILNRSAVGDPGLTYWTSALLNGASDENIIASILSSDEYFNSH